MEFRAFGGLSQLPQVPFPPESTLPENLSFVCPVVAAAGAFLQPKNTFLDFVGSKTHKKAKESAESGQG